MSSRSFPGMSIFDVFISWSLITTLWPSHTQASVALLPVGSGQPQSSRDHAISFSFDIHIHIAPGCMCKESLWPAWWAWWFWETQSIVRGFRKIAWVLTPGTKGSEEVAQGWLSHWLIPASVSLLSQLTSHQSRNSRVILHKWGFPRPGQGAINNFFPLIAFNLLSFELQV